MKSLKNEMFNQAVEKNSVRKRSYCHCLTLGFVHENTKFQLVTCKFLLAEVSLTNCC